MGGIGAVKWADDGFGNSRRMCVMIVVRRVTVDLYLPVVG